MSTAWKFMLLAILSEVMASLWIGQMAGQHRQLLHYLGMGALLAVSYYGLARAVREIPLGVAYAWWEALGLTLVTLFGVLWLGQVLQPLQWLGMAAMLTGILLIKVGTRDEEVSS